MLIEITLVQTALDKAILQFDGRVLEIFHSLWEGKTHRHHAATIAAIEIVTDKKGAHSLSVKLKAGYNEIVAVEPAALGRVEQLVSAVQQAMIEYM